MVKITDGRFAYPFWVDAGESYYIVYFRSIGGNFICLRDDILPPRVGTMFRYDELKKDIVSVKEASISLTINLVNVDDKTWKLLLYYSQNFNSYDLKMKWTTKIPEIDFKKYLGKIFTMSHPMFGRLHYLVVWNGDKVRLSFLPQLNHGTETYVTFEELVGLFVKDSEECLQKNNQTMNHGVLEYSCYFTEPDVFLKLT